MSTDAREQILFDPTSEIFATDASGTFHFALTRDKEAHVDTSPYDEVRLVVSLWHPSGNRSIDLDRAYVEMRVSLDPQEDHWIKLSEVEPVVPPHNAGSRFDGWIILPIFAAQTAFAVGGSGFEPRARVQIRTAAYLVS